MNIGKHNLLQAYQLETLADTLPPSGKWSLELEHVVAEEKTYVRLLKGKKHVYATPNPLNMVTYIEALIALEGKQ